MVLRGETRRKRLYECDHREKNHEMRQKLGMIANDGTRKKVNASRFAACGLPIVYMDDDGDVALSYPVNSKFTSRSNSEFQT